ncbi:MAG: DNA-directed RNA polymerase subunit delta [Solobacterium sp.]|nr:DNA-directed RNA polymerase subunit delta [Solobacterium sp.]
MSLSTKESMTDAAFTCLSKRKKEVEFSKLWQEVSKAVKVPEEQMSRKKAQFYSALMLDNRFASLKGNKWDLRNRRKFEEVHTNAELLSDAEDDLEVGEEDDDSLDLPRSEDEY